MTTAGNQVFGSRYELGEQIARGGTAQVFVARDLLLGRPVALKVLFSELSSDSAFVARFRREAQAAANLSHPNIVPIFDWGEADSTYFIVMEYVDGEALSSIIRTQAPLAPAQAASVASDIAKALAYAHRHGVVHRDVKPGNVLITADGQVKVTDFGIARATGADEQVTQTGLVMGTATYFSPEQAQGFAVDGRSDVYSLGVVLYEMVTGKPPFSGESPVSIAYQHVRERPQPPSIVNPAVPAPLEAVILQAMAKSPADRYQTADALRADLDRFVHGQPVLARAASGEDEATISVPATTLAAPTTAAALTVGAAETVEKERRPRSTTPMWLGAGGVFAVAIGLIIYFGGHSLGYFGGASYFEVPSVTGLSEQAAFAKLEAKGLDPVKESGGAAQTSADAGKVVRQSPTQPSTVRRCEKVKVYVAGNPRGVPVPTVTSLTASSAEGMLTSQGFKYTIKYVRANAAGLTQGSVVNENPSAGTVKPPGTTVTLDVVRGYATTTVPNINGDSVQAADSALQSAGLVPATPQTEYSQTVPQGDIISSSPAQGQPARFGQAVSLVVSGGNLVTIPDVTGQPYQNAEAELNAQDLSYQIFLVQETDPSQANTVVRQAPMANKEVHPGYAVKIYVAVANAPTSSSPGNSGNTGANGGGL
jgi:eukaryotic-like serine/threonine-protein kinase